MKIVKYKVLLNEDNKNVLVKENAQLYYCAGGVLNSPEKIVQMCNEVLQANRLAEEYIWLLAFNTKNRLIGLFEISHGAVDLSILRPREVFIRLFLCGAVSFILVHNHPSGDPTPSQEDMAATERHIEVGKTMGIPLLDHIIIGSDDRGGNFYFSMRERNLELFEARE